MTDNNLEISVIIPVYNSMNTLEELTQGLEDLLANIVDTRYEIIFINDGSTDNSWKIIKEIALLNQKVTAINLTRNFGQQGALMSGFSQATGKYIVTIDDDLQNPTEEIEKLYDNIKDGYDVVYGEYNEKKHSKFRNIGSGVMHYVYKKIFGLNYRISSFRIIKQDIIKGILLHKSNFIVIDGLIAWLTTNVNNVKVEHYERKFGRSGYSLRKLLILTLNLITTFSIVPLQIATLVGFLFALLGFIFGIFFMTKKMLFGIPISGFTSTIVAITIFSGVQLLMIGFLGEYLGRIHINVNNKPQYAIREIAKYEHKNDEKVPEAKSG